MFFQNLETKNKTRFFSIHNLLNFVVIDHTGFFNRFFDRLYKHYANFKTNGKLENCDLIIELGDFKPDLENSYNVGDGKYFFQENYIYISKEEYKGAKWRFDVQGLNGGKTIARIDCNCLGRIFITGNVIEFLIHFKLLEKGYPIIHASAIDKSGSAFIFSSRGGAGKTTIALEMISNGFNFIGDNYIIIHKGNVLAFPTYLSIFTYNLVSVVSKNLNFKELCVLEIKKFLYIMTGGYAKFFTKINPKRLTGNFVNSSAINTALILVPKTNISDIQLEKIDSRRFAKYIQYNQMLEFSLFNRYIEEYSYLFPEEKFASHWERYKESILENSKYITYRKMIVPQKYDKNLFENVMEAIK